MPGGLALLEIEGQEEDVFISESNVGSALHGDTVQVTLLSREVRKTPGRCRGSRAGPRDYRAGGKL